MTALSARGEGHARELIAGLLQECREGVSDRESGHLWSQGRGDLMRAG